MESVKPGVAMIGRSPYGERGLKCGIVRGYSVAVCRSPYGERGLKLYIVAVEAEADVAVALLTESVD